MYSYPQFSIGTMLIDLVNSRTCSKQGSLVKPSKSVKESFSLNSLAVQQVVAEGLILATLVQRGDKKPIDYIIDKFCLSMTWRMLVHYIRRKLTPCLIQGGLRAVLKGQYQSLHILK